MIKAAVILAVLGCVAAGDLGGYGGLGYASHNAHYAHDAAHVKNSIGQLHHAAATQAIDANNAAIRDAANLNRAVYTQHLINEDGATRNAIAASHINKFASHRDAAIVQNQIAVQRAITLAAPAAVYGGYGAHGGLGGGYGGGIGVGAYGGGFGGAYGGCGKY